MKECTYYDLLGVSKSATQKEITDAKNFLAKKFHPDSNIDGKFDTTVYIQNVLYAYKILSDEEKRSRYDKLLSRDGKIHRFRGERGERGTHSYRHSGEERTYTGPLSPNFTPYWEAANKLNELVNEGALLLNQKGFKKEKVEPEKISALSQQAQQYIKTLEEGSVPKEYWHSHAINWILLQWSQNRDLPYIALFQMYDAYVAQYKNMLERKKLSSQATAFQSTLEKMMSA